MALRELFALITERRRRSDEQSREAGAQIRRRLQELLSNRTSIPTREVETPLPVLAAGVNKPAYRADTA
jgi:hypothetical protein